jgi:phosphate:Na+ symporter
MTAAALDAAEQAYQALKAALLAAGADGQLPMAAMEQTLSRYSALRRAAQQQAKATMRPDAMTPPSTAEEGVA